MLKRVRHVSTSTLLPQMLEMFMLHVATQLRVRLQDMLSKCRELVEPGDAVISRRDAPARDIAAELRSETAPQPRPGSSSWAWHPSLPPVRRVTYRKASL